MNDNDFTWSGMSIDFGDYELELTVSDYEILMRVLNRADDCINTVDCIIWGSYEDDDWFQWDDDEEDNDRWGGWGDE